MAREQRVEPEVKQLWQDFHDHVNMTSEQLRTWLLTQGSGEEGFSADPTLDVPEPGRSIMHVKAKRKSDLTQDDINVMRDTIDEIENLLEARPATGPADGDWRHALLDLGHDPLLAER